MNHRISGVAVVLLALLGCGAAGTAFGSDPLEPFERVAEANPQSAQAQFNLGVMSLKAADYARAAKALSAATKLAPGDAEGWEAYGTALLALKDAPAAATALKRSALLDPARAGAWLKLGEALGLDGSKQSLGEAIDACGRAARLRPGDPRPLLNQGLFLARLGLNARAEAVLKNAARMDGGQAALGTLCVLYTKDGAYSDAEDACRRAAENGGGAQPWYDLGFALERSGRNADARRAYDQAVQIDPGQAAALYAIAFLDYQAGNADAALAGFQKALKARNNDYPEAEYNVAVLLGDQGRYEEAADLYRALLKEHPGDPDAKANLDAVVEAGLASLLAQGQSAYELGDLKLARLAWERARRLDPGNGEAARMLTLTRVHDAAAEAAQAAREAAKSAVTRRLNTQDADVRHRGLEAFADGRYHDAARLLAFYLRNHPDDGEVRKDLTEAQGRTRAAVDDLVRRATAALSSGDRAKAGALAQEALRQDPGSVKAKKLRDEAGRAPESKADLGLARARYYQGVEQYLAGDLSGAVATWTDVLKLQPDYLDARRSLARAQLELQALKRLGQG